MISIYARGERRHQAERLKAKRLKYSSVGFVMAETPKPCSCYMCGNPRKWFKKQTMQEQKMLQRGMFHD